MPMYKDNNLNLSDVTIVWDGINRPEQLEAKPGQQPGHKWNVKVVFPANHPDLALLEQLAQAELAAGEFKGVLPNGGMMPVSDVGPTEFNGMFPGHKCVNVSTFMQPQIFDEQVQPLDPMQWGQFVYTGQRVNVLLFCKTYNNKSRGVAARMAGLQVLTSKGAQRLQLGGGIDAAAAFGGSGGAAPVQQPVQQPGAAATPQQPAATPAAQVYKHTDPSFTKEQWLGANPGWTEADLVANGKGVMEAAPAQQPAATPNTPGAATPATQVYKHTDPSFTKEQWLQANPGWTEADLVANGKGVMDTVAATPQQPVATPNYPQQAQNFMPQ